jgi:hypothetical protein
VNAIIPPLLPPQEVIPAHAPSPSDATTKRRNGLAITSKVLGLFSVIPFWLVVVLFDSQRGTPIPDTVGAVLALSMFCCIPAVTCGHIARRHARRQPAQYGGAGYANSGLAFGYAGILMMWSLYPLARAKERAQALSCANNMKQIILAFKSWQID